MPNTNTLVVRSKTLFAKISKFFNYIKLAEPINEFIMERGKIKEGDVKREGLTWKGESLAGTKYKWGRV